MTVRKSIIFAARLLLRPICLQDGTKTQFAEQILTPLELKEFADMPVGEDEAVVEGLAKYARKRWTVVVELSGKTVDLVCRRADIWA